MGKKLVGVKLHKKNELTALRGLRRGREGEQRIGRAATRTMVNEKGGLDWMRLSLQSRTTIELVKVDFRPWT
jgi:hypothetical protein